MQSSALDLLKLIYALFAIGLSVLPLIAVIWILAWLKDIRIDTRRILQILKNRFPEDFPKE